MPSRLSHFSCALRIGMRILWGEGVVFQCVGVGEWVVSGNEGLTEEWVFGVFWTLYVCMSACFEVPPIMQYSISSV